MADFPTLRSGAVSQYPLQTAARRATRILQFIDGSEQRFRAEGPARRRWIIRLDYLSEEELRNLGEFFAAQAGRGGQFRFTDPGDGRVYANCSFEHDEVRLEQVSEGRARSVVTVKENVG